MKIKKIVLTYLRLPMTIVFKTSFGTIDYRPALIIELEDESGAIGRGEASLLDVPISEPETTADSIELIKNKITPLILNQELSVEDLYNILEPFFVSHPVTLAGIEAAFLHLNALKNNQELVDVVGGSRRPVSIGMSIGIQPTVEDLLRSIEKAVEGEYGRIKIKIDHGYDVDIVRAVRERFPDIALSVDANAAYTEKDFEHLLQLDQFNLVMIEQPFGGDELELHASFQSQMKTPICLDEGVMSVATAKRAIELGSCRVVNIKPSRVGGLRRAREIHDLCAAAQIPCWVGGRLETGLGSLFNLIFATLPNITHASEVLPAESFLKEDILMQPLLFQKGKMSVPENEQTLSLNQEVVKRYTFDKIELA